MNELLKKLKSFHGLAGSLFVLMPGFSFFITYSPPLFDEIAILASALAAAFLWLGFKSNTNYIKTKKSGILFLCSAFILTLTYLLILDQTSIKLDNDESNIRYQIGYNVSKWSLNESTVISIKNNTCPSESKESLLYCYSASRESIFLIWKRWSIYLFGIVNILLFTVSSVMWSYGWGKLIRSS